jgi:hypothetical protein
MWPIVVGGRFKSWPESPHNLAASLAACLARLATLDPIFRGWIRGGERHHSVVPRLITLPPDEVELRSWITESAVFGSRAKRKQHAGYSIGAMTPKSNSVYVDFCLRSQSSEHWLGNGIRLVLLDSQSSSNPPTAAVSLESLSEAFFREVVTIVGTAFGCEWAAVMPGDFRPNAGPFAPFAKYQSGWMVYLDPSLVRHFGKLEEIGVEKLANNGILITTVSDARFDAHNPVHRAAAGRLQAALALLDEKRSASTAD